MNAVPTVYVVDDDPVVRDALTLLIEQDGLQVEAFPSAEAFLEARELKRGCLITDVRMPGMDGLRLQEEINRRDHALPIIFLTGHGDIPMSVRVIKAGAVDFLTKPITRDALMSSIHSALKEGDWLHEQAATNVAARSRLAGLTEREREVMLLAVEGRSNKEIGRQLGISHRTVEVHKARVMQKTSAASLLELARIAEDSGIAAIRE